MAGDHSTDTTATDTGHDSGHGVQNESLIIFFLAGGLLLGGLFKEINKKTGIPYTPMLFILGIVAGFFYMDLGFFGQSLHAVSDIDPHGLLLIFLPILIFESGFNADWHIFKKQLLQIIILAVPCVFVSAIFIAFSMKVVLGYDDTYYTWLTAFMFGAILSCTDTVAVLALLKEAGASKKFNSLIEGESLINDGTCMVLLTIASEFIRGGNLSPSETAGVFLQLTIGGVVLGVIGGVICAIWIRKIFNDEILVVNITFIACYLVYFVAENVDLGIKISGIIALVSLGLFMAAFGKTRINAESEHAVHTFWKFAVYCAETIIFLVAGIIIGVKMLTGERDPDAKPIMMIDFVKLFGLYICMTISRFLAIAVFMPILRRHGYGLTWKEVFVLTYGGLRGAIGISFALIVAKDPIYNATLRQFILFDMAGCAFLTLVINGTTTGYFVKRAGLAGASPIKQRVFLAYLEQFMQQIRDCQEELRIQPYLSAVDWSRVNELVGIPKLEALINDEMDKLAQIDEHYQRPSIYKANASKKPSVHEAPVSPVEGGNELGVELLPRDSEGRFGSSISEGMLQEKLIIEARNRFLMALKGEYYHLFSLSQCGAGAFLLLKESADWDLDKEANAMTSWDHVSSHFMNPHYIGALFFLKGFPILGQMAKNSLFNHLAYVYDVVLNYVNAHEAVEAIADSFPFTGDVIQVILNESEENRTMAENYLNNYLNVSFPEINKSIQNKKASFNILNRAKEYLEETYDQGQLEDKEFKTLKKVVDTFNYNLGQTYEPWDLLPLNEFIKKLIFFSYFSDEEIKEIMADAVEKPFSKDEFIVKENQKADYLFVITRGIATESCRRTSSYFKEKKAVGSVISYHQIISSVQRYQTSVVADSVVYAVRLNLQTVRKLLKKHKDVEEYLWRESFFFLAKMSNSGLGSFEYLDRATLSQILTLFTFKKYKAEQTIDFTRGGIFLRGQATFRGEKTQHLKPEKGGDESDEKKLLTLAYFTPGPQNILKADRPCWVFHFVNFEKIVELVNSGAAEREKSRSMSFASFRRQSAAKPKITRSEHHDREDVEAGGDRLSPTPHSFNKKQLETITE